MQDKKGFDLWADDYDKSVGLSDKYGSYPFAGYKSILNVIYNSVICSSAKTVLDIGFGTAVLTSRLYENGCTIYGQDFSDRMIEIAKEKMPKASLYKGDFSNGLVEPIQKQKYDAIIATYSLHHLTDFQKVDFITSLFKLLNEGGCIYIGDIAFETRSLLQECMRIAAGEWDSDEMYFVWDELKGQFPEMRFEKMSDCSGLITLQK